MKLATLIDGLVVALLAAAALTFLVGIVVAFTR